MECIYSAAEIGKLAERLLCGIMEPNQSSLKGKKHFMEDWDWYQGVALFGMYQYYRFSENPVIHEYLVQWFDTKLEEGNQVRNINSMCPLLTLSFLYEDSMRQDYLKTARSWAETAMHDLPRTEECGLQHYTIDSLNEGQLWDDTLYMTVLFIARMGRLLEDEQMKQESVYQFLLHVKYLLDVKTGLFFHGWTFEGRHHFADALWGRGNAWYTAGLVDYLDLVVVEEGPRSFLLETLRTQVKALAEYQDECGMWHTLINDTSSYLEASATAGFGYGILKAVRLGYIDASYKENGIKALNAVLPLIDENGILHKVSKGTRVLDTLQMYRDIAQGAEPYGQSMALLLAMEALKMEV